MEVVIISCLPEDLKKAALLTTGPFHRKSDLFFVQYMKKAGDRMFPDHLVV
jgi:hypothetical protein